MIRLERRLDTPRWVVAAVPVGSMIAALVLAGVVLLVTGHNPLSTYRSMVQSGFTGPSAFSATLLNATPLLFTGLCAAVAFRMRIYNIGGEGQLYVGAVAASGAGLLLGGAPGFLIILGMMLAAVLAGAVWGAIPGVLRSYLNTNEILTSLMLNYVAGLLAYYLIFDSNSYWRDTTSLSARVFPQGKSVSPPGWWPALHLGSILVPFGFLMGLVAAVGLFVVLRSTCFGFKLRVIADSPEAGRYAGMRTKRAIVGVMILSGAFAGFAGASQVGDFSHLLDPKALQQAAYGYTGIVVAALARFNPVGAIASAILLGALTNAGFALQGATFPQGLVGTIEGIILFSVLSAELLSRYRVRLRRQGADLSAPGSVAVDAIPVEGNEADAAITLRPTVNP